MADQSTFTHPLLIKAGIPSIPVDGNGCLKALYMPSIRPQARAPGTALIGCWHGQDPARLEATAQALRWILKSGPMPRIYIVEAARPQDTRHFSSLEGIAYIPRTIYPESEGIWMKEALWSIGARQAIKDGCTKLVFLDLDCNFVRQDWTIQVSKALDEYDVISPHMCFYYSGQPDGASKGLMASKGYTLSTGHPGMSIGMTAAFFTERLGAQIPNYADSAGDTFFWLSLQRLSPASPICRRLPHILTEADCRGVVPKPLIGHGGQVLVHHPHGTLGTRNYAARAAVTRECFPRYRGGVEYLNDGMPRFSDAERGRVFRKAMTRVMEDGCAWTWTSAGLLTRQLLEEAGLKAKA